MVQLKQWNENVGFSAIQGVFTVKQLHNAARSMIICTSAFTKPAIQTAEKLSVELLDGKQLLAKLLKHQLFSPPEPETDQPK